MMRFDDNSKQQVIDEIRRKVIGGLTFTFRKPNISINSVESYTSLTAETANHIQAHLVASLNNLINVQRLSAIFSFRSAEERNHFQSNLINEIAGNRRLDNIIKLHTGEGIHCTGLTNLYFQNTKLLVSAFILPHCFLPVTGTNPNTNMPPSLYFSVDNIELFNQTFSAIIEDGTLRAIQLAIQAREMADRAAVDAVMDERAVVEREAVVRAAEIERVVERELELADDLQLYMVERVDAMEREAVIAVRAAAERAAAAEREAVIAERTAAERAAAAEREAAVRIARAEREVEERMLAALRTMEARVAAERAQASRAEEDRAEAQRISALRSAATRGERTATILRALNAKINAKVAEKNNDNQSACSSSSSTSKASSNDSVNESIQVLVKAAVEEMIIQEDAGEDETFVSICSNIR